MAEQGAQCGGSGGWRIETGPHGTVRMRSWRHPKRDMGVPTLVIGIVLCLLCSLIWVCRRMGAKPEVVSSLVVFAPLAIVLVVEGLWEVFGTEEWLVGPDQLELRQRLLGCRRSVRFRGATLKLIRQRIVSYPQSLRGLSVCYDDWLPGGRVTDSGVRWRLFVVERGRKRCLRSGTTDRLRRQEFRALGEFLSHRTGWPLIVHKQRSRP
jgi:hypothetical protein